MNIKITDLDMILNYLETTSLESHDDYTSEITYKDQKILYRYIKELQQERNQFKEYTNHNYDKAKKLQQENKQLKGNWNKLKKELKNEIKHNEEYDKTNDCEWKGYNAYYEILEIMQELESGDINE